MRKRLLALALAVSLLAGCGSVGSQESTSSAASQTQSQVEELEETQPETVKELRLGYNVNDTLNPYTMTTQLNLGLTPLLYDSLVKPDKSFHPVNQLAQEVVMTGDTCTITLRKDALFSDGTRLTGEDVIYSLGLAITPGGYWQQQLTNMAGYALDQEGRVVIRLHQPDADFPLQLTFPIVKKNTGQQDYPVGVSRFYVSGTWGNTGVTLTANPLYYGEPTTIETIRLVKVTSSDGLAFAVKSGDVDLAYSDLENQDLGSLAAGGQNIALTNFVYLGINGANSLLSQPSFRQALDAALSRDELVSKAYDTKATSTQYPFHPDFYRLENLELSTPRRLAVAEQLLEGMGLVEENQDGYRLRDGQPITLRLLVNSENTYRNAVATLVAEQIRQAGIRVNVVSQTFDQYQASLAAGQYDLYIGEIRLTDNMDFSTLMPGGALAYGAPENQALSDLYWAYRSTGEGIEAFCQAFLESPPFLPLVFLQGTVVSQREFRSEIVATQQDIFYNIMEW